MVNAPPEAVTTTYELGSCPACGSTDAGEFSSQDEVRAELETLWLHHLRRLRPGIEIGDLYDRTYFSQQPPLRLAACATCGTIYRNPRETARELRAAYEQDQPDECALALAFEAQQQLFRTQAERLTRLVRPGRAVEVGCYYGGFLGAARALGWQVSGLDVNPHHVAFARSLGFHAMNGGLEEVELTVILDAVAIWNCFDQIGDHNAVLAAAHRLLRPGGVLALRVPNGGCYARLRNGPRALRPIARRVLALNNLLGFPYRTGFTRAGLARLLGSHGFRQLRVVYDVLPAHPNPELKAWARLEAKLVASVLRALPLRERAPWLEVYAVRL